MDCKQDKQLRDIQRLQRKLLQEVDRLCRVNQIQYFLSGGALLGAVRHQGFIPWDDDVDIILLRKDYDTLCRVAPTQLGEEFFWQDHQTDPASAYLYRKVRLNGTVMSTSSSSRIQDMHNGVFLDVFVCDHTADFLPLAWLHIAVTYTLGALITTKWLGEPRKNKLKAVTTAALPLLRRTSMTWLHRRYDRTASFFSRRKRVGNYLISTNDIRLPKGRYPAQWFSEAVPLPFEGGHYPAPVGWEGYLTWRYGDFRQLPPPEERHSGHHLVEVNLGRYAADPLHGEEEWAT